MGLMDILNGMQHGPRGQRQPTSGSSGGGMSPLTMALIGLLAYKALKHFGGNQQQGTSHTTGPTSLPGGNQGASPSSGNLSDLLKGRLGGLQAGGAAGSVLSGGLTDLLKQFEQAGQGDVAKSWVGTGPNKQISPDDIEKALGQERVNALAEQAGLSRVALLSGLSEQLPEMVDQLTPHGRLPTEEEASSWV
jgi:uncharacterized protein YidB (DUF937 family)